MAGRLIHTYPSLAQFPGLVCGTSFRQAGSFQIKNRESAAAKSFFAQLKIPYANTVFMHQIHSGDVAIVDNTFAHVLPQVDGLITAEKGKVVCAVTADCLPLLFYDPEHEVSAVVHAGYKGLLKDIIQKTITAFKLSFMTQPNQLYVAIGPGIGNCCYSVEQSRSDLFTSHFPYLKNISLQNGNVFYLDLKSIAMQVLQQTGILFEHIEESAICTKCQNDRFFSYRGDTKETFGEMVTFIGKI